MANYSKEKQGPGRLSKIDKYRLGPSLVKYNRQYPFQPTKIARLLTKELNIPGVTFCKQNVSWWIDHNNVAIDAEEINKWAEVAKAMHAEDRTFIVGKYDSLLSNAFEQYTEIYNNPEIKPWDKLNAINEVMKTLTRGLDAHGYGKETTTNVNIQMNFIQERVREFVDIIREECGEYKERVIERIELLATSD